MNSPNCLRLKSATLAAALLLTACGGGEPEATHDHNHAAPGAHDVWPPDGATVFATQTFAIGDGSHQPAGRFAVVQGTVAAPGTALKAGDRVQFMEPGATTGTVKLPVGETKVTVVELDGADKVMKGGMQKALGLTVKAGPENPGVQWIEPKDGATVGPKFTAKFKATGYGTVPAGNTLDLTTGHHHILVNLEPGRPGYALPNNKTHLHYGKAEEEAELELPPGTHTLTLQFADGAHRSFGKGMSKTITVTVKE